MLLLVLVNDSICKQGLLTGKGECYSSGTNITRIIPHCSAKVLIYLAVRIGTHLVASVAKRVTVGLGSNSEWNLIISLKGKSAHTSPFRTKKAVGFPKVVEKKSINYKANISQVQLAMFFTINLTKEHLVETGKPYKTAIKIPSLLWIFAVD